MMPKSSIAVAELLGARLISRIGVLVPKRRGVGFLAVPLGHHPDPGLDRISTEFGADIFGLDGCLDIMTGARRRDAQFSAIMERLATHYQMTWREVTAPEF